MMILIFCNEEQFEPLWQSFFSFIRFKELKSDVSTISATMWLPHSVHKTLSAHKKLKKLRSIRYWHFLKSKSLSLIFFSKNMFFFLVFFHLVSFSQGFSFFLSSVFLLLPLAEKISFFLRSLLVPPIAITSLEGKNNCWLPSTSSPPLSLSFFNLFLLYVLLFLQFPSLYLSIFVNCFI